MEDKNVLDLLRDKNFVDAKTEINQMLNAKAFQTLAQERLAIAATYSTPKE